MIFFGGGGQTNCLFTASHSFIHPFIHSFIHLFIHSFIRLYLKRANYSLNVINMNRGISWCSRRVKILHIPSYCVCLLPPFISCHVCPGLPLYIFSWLLFPLWVPSLSLWCPQISEFPISFERKNILRVTCRPSLREMFFFTDVFTKDRVLCHAYPKVTQIDNNINIISCVHGAAVDECNE